LYAPDAASANRAAKAAFARIHQLNGILSDYDRASELSRLSAASPTSKPVPLSDPLWLVLSRSQRLAEQTAGAFDVTVGPYVRLWRRARRDKQMPSPERLAQARAAVGYKHLQLDSKHCTAELLRPRMILDLGGIAMGYAIDEALAVLASHGISRALVDGSGDIAAGESPPDAAGWRIGVAPLGAEGTPSRYVLLSRAALTTSGDAFQYVEIGGERYSHIVDPKTGLGLTTRTGVTIIAKDCITADSLATAVSVLGPQAGLKLVEKTAGAAALIVRATATKPEIIFSPGFNKYVVEPAQPSAR
jgi:FAD:protein FMN transferase